MPTTPMHQQPHPDNPFFVWDSNAGGYVPLPPPSWVVDNASYERWASTPIGSQAIAAARSYGATFAEQEESRLRLATAAGVAYQRQTYAGENIDQRTAAVDAELARQAEEAARTPAPLPGPVIVEVEGRRRVIDTIEDLDFALRNGGVIREGGLMRPGYENAAVEAASLGSFLWISAAILGLALVGRRRS